MNDYQNNAKWNYRPTLDFTTIQHGRRVMTRSAGNRRVSDPSQAGPGIKLLLWNLQSAINFGMLLRVAETYRVPIGVFGDNLAASTTARDFACGAIERVGFERLPDATAALAWRGHGRLIATSIEHGAEPLSHFQFEPGDVVVLGNEYDGLPPTVEKHANRRLLIPMADVWTPKPHSVNPIDAARTAPVARDGTPNLNVAIAGAIVCYAAYIQAVKEWSAGETVLA
jgi:tRNA G18 (ribose-2'-O)-methylase SpoU